ncbi:MAG: exo-alpha-sialidase [Planctomycetota bacterium]
MTRFLPVLALTATVLAGSVLAAETGGPVFCDDFRTLENVEADETKDVAQLREFPRIVTRPDVRINRLDPSEYKDSNTGRPIGYGWFPKIIRLQNGELLCLLREGNEHGMKDLEARTVLARSKNGGRTWGQAEIVQQMKDWGVSFDAIAQSDDGAVWLDLARLKVAGEGKGRWVWSVVRSTDNAHTWEEVSDKYGMAPMVAMSNGELLWRNWGTPEKSWYSWHMTYTTTGLKDGKLEWSAPRYHPELGSSDEWMVTETKNPGELVAMMRMQWDGDFYGTAKSHDYGKTWTNWRSSNVHQGAVPCRPMVHTMPDGRLIFAHGQRWIGRTFAVVSKDDGETWDVKHRQTILHSPRDYHKSWDSHYTDIAQAEGDVWIGVDYIASPGSQDLRGVYGTFIDARYFDDVFHGVTLAEARSPVTDKTVGWWRFDEREGDFAQDSVSNNYGEIHGAKRVSGKVGTALAFDGKDNYVMIYDDDTLWVPNCFTVEAWINTTDATIEQTIMSKAPKYTLLLREGKPVLEIGPYRMTADMKAPLQSNRWYHIMVVYGLRPNYPKATFLVDGQEISFMKPDYSAITSYDEAVRLTDRRIADGPMFQSYDGKIKDTECLVIGMDNDLKGRPFHGAIDEVLLHAGDLNEKIAKNPAPRGYPERGSVTSRAITKPDGAKWTTFEAKTAAPDGTKVSFSILDAAGKTLIEDVKPGADLASLTDPEIRLRAILQTTDAGQTPVLLEWSVGTSADKPAPKLRRFPDQCAPKTGEKGVQMRWKDVPL